MAVKIRLQRQGKRSRPVYRVVAMERTKKRNGKTLETIGLYDPLTDPATFTIDKNKLDRYLRTGAQMSQTVQNQVKKII